MAIQSSSNPSTTSTLIKGVLSIVAAAITAAVPAYVAYDLYGRGPNPPKRLEVTYSDAAAPLQDLSALNAKIELKGDGGVEKLEDVRIIEASIKNTGASPVLPTEIFEPLDLHVSDGWRIIGLQETHSGAKGAVKLKWHKVDNSTYATDPALINPGEGASATVYITQSKEHAEVPISTRDVVSPTLEWSGRIANLKEFTSPDDNSAHHYYGGGIEISHSGWSIVFIICSALVYQALYIILIEQIHTLTSNLLLRIGSYLTSMCLSISASEASATYLFPNTSLHVTGTLIWLNAPFIVFNAALLGVLLWYTRKIKAAYSSAP